MTARVSEGILVACVGVAKRAKTMKKSALQYVPSSLLLLIFAAAAPVFAGDMYKASRSMPAADETVSTASVKTLAVYKEGPYSKVAAELLQLETDFTAYTNARGTQKDPFVPAVSLMRVTDGYILIDALAISDSSALMAEMIGLGAINVSRYGRYVSGRVPISMMKQLAALEELRFARPFYAETRVGSVDSQGDVAQASDVVRDAGSPPAFTGAGLSVGVLSDSYDCGFTAISAADDIVSGDLPAGGVNVLQEEPGCGSGTDEGRGMLQIVLDVAPDSALLFNTAFGGIASFANGIGALVTAGADVVVDDVFYFAEPMFQDGIIAQAAAAAVAAGGVPYFSSAGNSAAQAYESPFVVSGGLGPSGFDAHDFDPGPGVSNLQSITVPVGGGSTIIFQWSQPFGAAVTDLDIWIIAADGLTPLAIGGAVNIGGDPLEIFTFNNTGAFDFDGVPGADTSFFVLIENFAGPQPDLMRYGYSGSLTVNTFDTASGTSYGHASAPGAAGVAAAPYFDTPAFGQIPPLQEPFSSRADVPILFDINGADLGEPVFRARPNYTGPDGGNTTFFGSDIDADADTFPNFFGTSASAPHVAGVAALLLEADPTLTPAQINSLLADSAIEMGPAGFDVDTGTGLIQADDAEAAIANGSPTLEPIASQTGATGEVLVFNLDATVTPDPEANAIAFSQVGMPEPACVLVDGGAGTGTITCTLTAGVTGRFPILAYATDNGAPPRSDTQGLYLNANPNDAPTINQIATQNVNDGAPPLILNFSATDADAGQVLTYSTQGMPGFCSIDTADPNGPDTAQMTCNVGFNNSGGYFVTVKVTDDGVPLRAAATTFLLIVNNVNQDPVLDPIGAQGGDEGVVTSIAISASDVDIPDTLTYSLTGEPTFCSLTDNTGPTGNIACSPGFADAGPYPFTVTVTDAFAGSDFEVITFTANDVNRNPILDFVGNFAMANNTQLVINLTSSDPDGDGVTLSGAVPAFCGTSYPAGTGAGTITCNPGGTPDNGSYFVTVTATDDGTPNLTDDELFEIRVGEPGSINRAPAIVVSGNQPFADNQQLTITLSSTDPDGDGMTFINSTFPTFCALNNGSGAGSVVCNPTFGDAGQYAATMTVTDLGDPALSSSEQITIDVFHGNSGPTAVAGPDQATTTLGLVLLDGSGSFDLETASVDLLYSWRVAARPPGSTFQAATIFDRTTDGPSFIADVDGTYIIELRVTDEDNGVDVDTVSVVADSPKELYFTDARNGRLSLRSTVTGGELATRFITIPGDTVPSATAVAVNPLTNEMYSAVRLGSSGGGGGIPTPRHLVTLDPTEIAATYTATLVGSMGDAVAGLDFGADGTLYAVTGDGAVAPESLFTVDTGTGAMTLVSALGNGNDGEGIAFNSNDGLLYHTSGLADSIFETINPANGNVVASIPYSGDTTGLFEVLGLVYDPLQDLFLGTRGNGNTGNLDFFTVTPGGVTTDGAILSNQAWRGHAFWDPSFQVPTSVAKNGDHNNDGNADILWRNTNNGNGQNALWEQNGGLRLSNSAVPQVSDTDWEIVGDGDYDGDGDQDMLWRNATNDNKAFWLMDGGALVANVGIPMFAHLNWKVYGDGDYNSDGVSDIFWRNIVTGENSMWQINAGTLTANLGVHRVTDLNWVPIADGDFDGDGKSDVMWRNMSDGNLAFWKMDGASREFNLHVRTVSDLNWVVVGDGDANGDGKADLLWRNTFNGQNALWLMDGETTLVNLAVPSVSDQNWVVVGHRDYDGDGLADILWKHVTLGHVVFWGMDSGMRLSNVGIDTVSDLNWEIINLN